MTVNKIYNEDCLTGMARLPDKCIDLILCDLPYGKTNCRWDFVIPFKDLWNQYNRLIKDNSAVILTATQPFATDLINSNRKYFRYDIVWEKTIGVGFANSKRMPLRAHELILVFYKHLPAYNPQGLIKLEKPVKVKKSDNCEKDSVYNLSTLQKEFTREYTHYPRSVIKFSNGNNKSLHPTQKPLPLFEWLILTYSNAGDLVLDNCIGSGTTGVACINTGRRFIGFEKDKYYYDIACKRVFGI